LPSYRENGELFKENKSVEIKAGTGRPNRKTANAKVIVEAYSDYFFNLFYYLE
jgi:hypothetical protein